MAIIEPRLLPLIETLAQAGADWLAFEVLDGIRTSGMPEEHLETLAMIHGAVRSAKLENFRGEKRGTTVPGSVPQAGTIVGNDQIRWAAEYVHKRLEDALLMLQTPSISCRVLFPRQRLTTESRRKVAPTARSH
jgi:hypothetical protein